MSRSLPTKSGEMSPKATEGAVAITAARRQPLTPSPKQLRHSPFRRSRFAPIVRTRRPHYRACVTDHPLSITEESTASNLPVDDALIARVVDHFYERVREDARLGPLFASRISDWDRHLAKMRDFWSAALNRTGRYAGRPVEAHRTIEGLSLADFERWLELFRSTVREVAPPLEAQAFIAMAERMALAMTKMLGFVARDDGQVRAAPFVGAGR
jgi:hemoglobin